MNKHQASGEEQESEMRQELTRRPRATDADAASEDNN